MKIAFKRGSGAAAAVLERPEDGYVAPGEWRGRGPAPAGALQRGLAADPENDAGGYGVPEETAVYVPRRGAFPSRLRALPRSVGGRVLAGTVLVCVLGGLGLGAAALRQYLLHDERFVLTTSADIQVTGNEHLTRAQILSVFGADLERNIFRVPLGERQADVERLPWVAHATVMRLLPNQLRIAVTERTPVAFVRQGSRIGLVDAAGVLLDMPPEAAGDPHYSFPVLTGLAQDDPLPTRTARMEIYRRFVAELDSGKEKLSEGLSEVDVSNPEDVKALLPSGGTDVLVHFGDENFLQRYHEFQQHLPGWKQLYPKLASADMRYEGQIVLEMQAGTTVPLIGESLAPAELAAGGVKPAVKTSAKGAAKPVAKVVTKPGDKSAGVTPAGVKLASVKAAAGKPAAGKNDANAKIFAALAAEHKADDARAAKAAGKLAVKTTGSSGKGPTAQ